MWLIIALIAYFLNAIVASVDKYILVGSVINSVAYAFYIGSFSILALALAPFGFNLMAGKLIGIAFLAGILSIYALIFFFRALRRDEISRIVPIMGAFIALFTLVFSYFLLGERLASHQLMAFFLLVAGGFLIALVKTERRFHFSKLFPMAILASILFGLSYTLTKFIYSQGSFINGFIWIRIGGFIAALSLLLSPAYRKIIFQTPKVAPRKTPVIFISNQAMSAVAFILINYAIFLASASLVNALQGIQYVFLFLIAIFFLRKLPNIYQIQMGKWALIRKIVAISLIVLGLVILAIK